MVVNAGGGACPCRADGVGEEVHLSHPKQVDRLEGETWTHFTSSHGEGELGGTCCGRRYLARRQMCGSLL